MTDSQRVERLRELAREAFNEGRLLEALQNIDPVLCSGVASIDDWLFTGQALIKAREYAQAAEVLRTGLQLSPDHVELQYELAIARFQLGDVPAATRAFEHLARSTGLFQAWASLATVLPGCPASENSRILGIRREFVAQLQAGYSGMRGLVETVGEQGHLPVPGSFSSDQRGKRIRVGYISAFFHRANYMKPVWGLINGHDRNRFQIELFADASRRDQFDWLRSGTDDLVHSTSEMDNDALGDFIRSRSLDVVVDLNGYSDVSRLALFTRRMAPVVVAWFNMYATSALPCIDWIVGDNYVIPAEEEPFYSERVFRLPHSYLGFEVGHRAPDVVPPPCMKEEVFTFGSLVSQYKITPAVLDAWSEILRRVGNSRLLLANRALQSSMNREYLIAEFAQRGITPGQLRLLPPADHFEYLQYYNQIDLALDAFPYNGGTTTTEAIWQGVPVLAFDGDRWAARTSRTLLMNCHLGEFVESGLREWIEEAVRWGSDRDLRPRLQEIRASMREQLLTSDVCQMQKMVAAMENFFAAVANQPPPGAN